MIESLTPLQGIQISMYGFVTVFLMLAFLMGVITCINNVTSKLATKKLYEPKTTTIEGVRPVSTPEYVGQIKLIEVDEKTAACIMAIISDETKIPLDQLIFKKITRMREGK